MALRPTEVSLVYAAFVVQAMFYIPQVRQQIALWGSSLGDDTTTTTADPGQNDLVVYLSSIDHIVERVSYKIVEFFTNMDLAILSEMSIDDLCKNLSLSPQGLHPPGDLSTGECNHNGDMCPI